MATSVKSAAAGAATGLVLPLVLLFGTSAGLAPSLAKIAVTSGVEAAGYALWICLGAGGVLLAIALARGVRIELDRALLRYAAFVGIVGVALPTVNMLHVLSNVPVGVAALLAPITPLLTYAFSQLMGLERFSLRRASGVALGFAGALLIILPHSSLPSPDMVGWVVMGMVTPALQAATNVYAALHRPAGTTSLALAVGMQLASAFALSLAVLPLGLFYAPQWPPGPPEAAIFGHICLGSLGTLLFFVITHRAGPVAVSQVAYVVTVTGVLWGMLLFGESHSDWFWAAMAVIFAGVALVTLPARRRMA
jgi:drug/metabolite transporter (DMT)-like permease